MSKRKVYESIGYLNYSHSIKLPDGKKRIQFTGGQSTPKIRFGKFVTNDKTIQKLLEADSLFNIAFKLLKVDNVLVNPPKVVLSIEAQLEAANELNANLQLKIEQIESKLPGKDEKVDEVEYDVASGIVNMQAARQYLIKTHNQEFKDMSNGEAVRLIAAKVGVQFPDWNWKK